MLVNASKGSVSTLQKKKLVGSMWIEKKVGLFKCFGNLPRNYYYND